MTISAHLQPGHSHSPRPSITFACGACKAARPTELAYRPDIRTPCPQCGDVSVAISASVQDTLIVTASLTAVLTPADQADDWQHRWDQAQKTLDILLRPRSDEMTSSAIDKAFEELKSFYVSTYHPLTH